MVSSELRFDARYRSQNMDCALVQSPGDSGRCCICRSKRLGKSLSTLPLPVRGTVALLGNVSVVDQSPKSTHDSMVSIDRVGDSMKRH